MSTVNLNQPELQAFDAQSEELQVIGLFDAKTLGCKILLRFDPSYEFPYTVTFSYPKPHSITKNRVDPYPSFEEAKQEFLSLHEAEHQAQNIAYPENEEGQENSEYANLTVDELEILLQDKKNARDYHTDALQDGNTEDVEDEKALITDLNAEIEGLEEVIKNKVLSSKGSEKILSKDLEHDEPEVEEEPDLDI